METGEFAQPYGPWIHLSNANLECANVNYICFVTGINMWHKDKCNQHSKWLAPWIPWMQTYYRNCPEKRDWQPPIWKNLDRISSLHPGMTRPWPLYISGYRRGPSRGAGLYGIISDDSGQPLPGTLLYNPEVIDISSGTCGSVVMFLPQEMLLVDTTNSLHPFFKHWLDVGPIHLT